MSGWDWFIHSDILWCIEWRCYTITAGSSRNPQISVTDQSLFLLYLSGREWWCNVYREIIIKKENVGSNRRPYHLAASCVYICPKRSILKSWWAKAVAPRHPTTTGNIRTLLFYSSNSRCRTSNVIIPFWLSHRRLCLYICTRMSRGIDRTSPQRATLFGRVGFCYTQHRVCVCSTGLESGSCCCAAYYSLGKIGELLSIIRTASSTPSIIFLSRLSFCCCCCCCWGQYRNVCSGFLHPMGAHCRRRP